MKSVLSYFNNKKYGVRIILLKNNKSKQTEIHAFKKYFVRVTTTYGNNSHSCTSLCFQFVLILPVHPYR